MGVNAQRVSSSRILLTNDFTNLILNMAKSTSSSQQVNEENTDDTTTTGKLFSLKKWNAVAMWSWDVECDTCAICRVQVMDACLRCQAESKADSRLSSASKDC